MTSSGHQQLADVEQALEATVQHVKVRLDRDLIHQLVHDKQQRHLQLTHMEKALRT